MEVILLEDVKALGKKGEVVKVSDGYAKNFILKKKLGVEANSANKNDLKLQKANEAKVAQEKLDAAKALAEELKDKKVVIKIKAGNGARVFGSISAKEIAAETKKQLGLEIDKKKIVMEEGIKNLGVHTVKVKLHKDVMATLDIKVEAL